MRNRLLFLSLSLALLAPAGCGHREENPAPHHRYSASILTGPSSSPLWTTAFPGIRTRLEDSCDMAVTSLEWKNDQALIENLDRLGSDGISLIVCTGGGYERALELIAPRYPKTFFLVQDTRLRGSNIRNLRFRLNGASYLAGIAASLLHPEALGVIRGCGGPWLESVESGFRDSLLKQHFRKPVPDYPSVDALLEAPPPRASVALYACDAPDPELLRRALKAKIMLIGIGVSAEGVVKSPCAGRIILDLQEALRRVAEDVLHASSEESGYEFDLGSGVIDFRINPEIEALNTPEALQKLEEARSAITAGVVEIEQMGM